jgi:hypothetical protein
MFLQEQHVSTQLRGQHQAGIYVLPFQISLLYQPDDGPLVGLKHVALVKTF